MGMRSVFCLVVGVVSVVTGCGSAPTDDASEAADAVKVSKRPKGTNLNAAASTSVFEFPGTPADCARMTGSNRRLGFPGPDGGECSVTYSSLTCRPTGGNTLCYCFGTESGSSGDCKADGKIDSVTGGRTVVQTPSGR